MISNTPITSSNEQKVTINKIHKEIIKEILTLRSGNYHFLGGRAGELPYLYLVRNIANIDINQIEMIISDDIDNLIHHLTTEKLTLGISNGISGIGWVLEFLNQQQEDYDVDFCNAIDELIYDAIDNSTWSGEVEYVLGLAGIAAFASRRLKQSPDIRLYSKIIDHYEILATQINEQQLTWSQPAYSAFRLNTEDLDEDEFNLGLAHGVPGIIAAILPALTIPSLHNRVKKLLIHSCNWLIEQQVSNVSNDSCYPTAVGSKEISRLGWCYGDLPIALTLARVGKALNNGEFTSSARNTAIHCCKRTAENGYIVDAGICHGSSGLILMFQLLNDILKEPELEQMAKFWLDFTLQRYKKDGLRGLYNFSGFAKQYEQDTGLLSGYAGIGLALITATTGNADWADSLLIK